MKSTLPSNVSSLFIPIGQFKLGGSKAAVREKPASPGLRARHRSFWRSPAGKNSPGTKHWSAVISAASVTLPFQPGPDVNRK